MQGVRGLASARHLWLLEMVNATEKMDAKKRGRPATGSGVPVQVRLQPDQLEWLDSRCAELEMSRPAAIRYLLEWARVKGS